MFSFISTAHVNPSSSVMTVVSSSIRSCSVLSAARSPFLRAESIPRKSTAETVTTAPAAVTTRTAQQSPSSAEEETLTKVRGESGAASISGKAGSGRLVGTCKIWEEQWFWVR